jgi:ABC-type cobalt transport system substrate-binding protein
MMKRLGVVVLALLLLAMTMACEWGTPGDRALDTYATPEPHWTTIRQTPEPAWQPPSDYYKGEGQ